MHPRIQMFLLERDRARLRGDRGVDRAITADLRRLGVPDEATLADPTGTAARVAPNAPDEYEDVEAMPRKVRPPRPRCEHGRSPDRCEECQALEVEETLGARS